MSTITRILCIEPAANLQQSLRAELEKRHYFVCTLPSERTALERTKADGTHLVIVNALAAAQRGPEICRALRLRGVDQPILLLLPEGPKPAPDTQADIVLIKPFTIRKVVNRIKKLAAEPRAHILQVGDIQMNCRTRLVRRGDTPPKKLTPKQAKLLEMLMRHPGQVLTRRFLMKHVWQTDYMGDTRTLEVHIRWLREKIEPNPSQPIYVLTKRRAGYLLALPETESSNQRAADR